MARQEFPTWRYGPDGEAQIFGENDKIPAGWQDHPSKAKGAGKSDGLDADKAVQRIEALEKEVEELRAENARLKSEDHNSPVATSKADSDAPKLRRTPAKTPAKNAKDQRKQDEELEQFRKEARATLKEMGIELPADATDAQLDEALTKAGK